MHAPPPAAEVSPARWLEEFLPLLHVRFSSNWYMRRCGSGVSTSWAAMLLRPIKRRIHKPIHMVNFDIEFVSRSVQNKSSLRKAEVAGVGAADARLTLQGESIKHQS